MSSILILKNIREIKMKKRWVNKACVIQKLKLLFRSTSELQPCLFYLKEYSPYTPAKQYTGSTLLNLVFPSAAQSLGTLLFKIRNCYLTLAKNSKDDTSILSSYSELFTIQGRKGTEPHSQRFSRICSTSCTLRCAACCHGFYNSHISVPYTSTHNSMASHHLSPIMIFKMTWI